jgi:hypothetical protein
MVQILLYFDNAFMYLGSGDVALDGMMLQE